MPKGARASSGAKQGKKQPPPPPKQKKRFGGAAGDGGAAGGGGVSAPVDVAAELPDDQRRFLECVSVAVPKIAPGSYPSAAEKVAEEAAVQRALTALDKYHMVVLDNALSEADLAAVSAEFHGMLGRPSLAGPSSRL